TMTLRSIRQNNMDLAASARLMQPSSQLNAGMQSTRETAKSIDHKNGGSARMRSSSPVLPTHPMLQLQEQAGNQAVLELLRTGALRAKLAISQPDDPEEREADQMAERIMRMDDKHYPFGSPCSCQLSGGEPCEECKEKQAG